LWQVKKKELAIHKSVFMSQLKTWLLIILVTLAFLVTGLGGFQDMFGVKLPFSKEHGWNDGTFLMLTAILVALVLK
jgi:hypothetical protein